MPGLPKNQIDANDYCEVTVEKMMQYAIEYAERGWYVFPCREKDGDLWTDDKGLTHLPRAKSPRIKQGLLQATTDKVQITQWWTKWPYAAIGCNCGASGLFVFDLDCKNGKQGWENFRDMGIEHGNALHSMTPSQGLHVIYRGDGKSSSNEITGIDTRGRGGYIILPPSELEGKGDYVQLDDWTREPGVISPDVILRMFPPIEKKEYTGAKAMSPSEEYTKAKKAISALATYRADDYANWVKVGMALRNLGADGLSLYHEFSKKSAKYNPAEVSDKWEKLETSQITLGTLFYYADQDRPDWWKDRK